jgi:hypothetical protein
MEVRKPSYVVKMNIYLLKLNSVKVKNVQILNSKSSVIRRPTKLRNPIHAMKVRKPSSESLNSFTMRAFTQERNREVMTVRNHSEVSCPLSVRQLIQKTNPLYSVNIEKAVP